VSVAAHNLTHDVTYEDLYRRWEEGNWKTSELDFTEDRKGWAALSDIQKRSGLWIYSMFFYGEDSVTDNLSPYIDAAPKEEQKYFLATQQVDEARHAIFFHRFFKEVLDAGDSIASTLAYTEPQLGWGYRKVFDRLDTMADELRKDRSLPKFAQAITLYHLIVEGALAQPGQHFIEDFFMKSGAMPGFSEGMTFVSRDEQRHIGFGVKVLSELVAESDECKAAIDELLSEVMRYSVAVFVPPGWNREYTECYGFSLEDIYAFGLKLIKQRWRTIGYPIEEMPPGVFPLDIESPEDEVARRSIRMLEAGVIGEFTGNPDSSPDVQQYYFESMARSADPNSVNGDAVTYQWRFSDAEPWHLVIENGSTRAVAGLAPNPNLTLETSWTDWISGTSGTEDMRKLMLKRRVKPRGSLRELARLAKVFPRSASSS